MLLLLQQQSMAQYVKDYKRNADNYYAKGDWYTAAQYYEKYLEQQQKPTNASYEPYTIIGTKAKKKQQLTAVKSANNMQEVFYRIATCYRQLNDFSKAETYYAKVASEKTTYPIASYYYAVALRANEKYADAEKQFNSFLKDYTTKDNFTAQAKIELANIAFIQSQLSKKDIDQYTVTKLGTAINAGGSNYAASFTQEGIAFTSSRADSTTISTKNKNPFINNIYKADNKASLQSVSKMNVPSVEGYEQGAASFTANGMLAYFTRWQKKDGKNVSSIYLSRKKDTTWGEPTKLGSNVNEEASSSKQPYVSADGSWLIYSSNRKNGLGKFDLWYVPLNSDGEPGSPQNLGANINTPEDEEAPFYSTRTQSLIFASNGKVGMGGFDLYESKGTIPNALGKAVNLGYPVNSVKDDSYFINNNSNKLLEQAIISTDRSSSCCLELFSITKVYKKYATGIITNCKTGQTLSNVQLTAKGFVQQLTDEKGSYLFEVKDGQQLQLQASKEGYNDTTWQITIQANAIDTVLLSSMCLREKEKPTPITDTTSVTPVVTTTPSKEEQVALFDFAKYNLRPETASLLDEIAGVLQRENKLNLEVLGYTDAVGSTANNFALSQQRADACKDYLVKKGIAPERIKAIGKGECCPIQPDTINGKDNPEGRKANRRVEFKMVFVR
jgi:outer membrane protein OmpA-like peptidoglycan-associated protein